MVGTETEHLKEIKMAASDFPKQNISITKTYQIGRWDCAIVNHYVTAER